MAKRNPPRPGSRPRAGAGRGRPSASRPTAGGRGGASYQPGGGGGAAPKAPPSSSASSAKRGAKRPDGTGMLKMVDLQKAAEEEEDDSKPKSATQFFALPRPKRAEPEPEPPKAAPPAGSPIAAAGASGPIAGGPIASAGAPAGGISGPIASGPISGPVAGGPIAGGPVAGTPFGAAPPPNYGQPEGESRAQSYRVLAIVLGLVMMVCAALVVTVGLAVGAIYLNDGNETVATGPAVGPPVPDKKPTRKVVDTGSAPPPPVAPAPTPRPRSTTPRKTTPKATAPAPSAPAAPAQEAGTLIVKIPGDASFTGIEVRCDGGVRKRGSFSGGTATVTGVPASPCEVFFKGGIPAKAKGAGGQTLNCTFPGGQAVCN